MTIEYKSHTDVSQKRPEHFWRLKSLCQLYFLLSTTLPNSTENPYSCLLSWSLSLLFLVPLYPFITVYKVLCKSSLNPPCQKSNFNPNVLRTWCIFRSLHDPSVSMMSETRESLILLDSSKDVPYYGVSSSGIEHFDARAIHCSYSSFFRGRFRS